MASKPDASVQKGVAEIAAATGDQGKAQRSKDVRMFKALVNWALTVLEVS